MQMQIIIDDSSRVLSVPDKIIDEGEDFYQKMDSDMDRGWQIGPDYFENPGPAQRCQIAADKILIAIDTKNENLLYLMAGYILSRMPGVSGISIDTNGDPGNTELICRENNK